MAGLPGGSPSGPWLEADSVSPEPDVRRGSKSFPRVPGDVGAGCALENVVEAPGCESLSREDGGGRQLVRAAESVDVAPPAVQERAEGHGNPLGIDLLIPKNEEPRGADAVPCEAADVANPKGKYTCTNHSEECPGPGPVGPAAQGPALSPRYGVWPGAPCLCRLLALVATFAR